MKKIILLFSTLVFFQFGNSQSANDKAKAYYMEASSAYQSKNYTKTLEYLGKTEEVLGTTNARILNLRIKAYYEKKEYTKAEECLKQFSAYSDKASESLRDETLPYIVKVEEAIAREEAARLAEQRRIEEERIAAEKRKEAARLAEIEKTRAEKEARVTYFDKYHADNPKMDADAMVPYEKDGKWGFINGEGETVVPFKYEEAKYVNAGCGAVKHDGMWGFVNEEGILFTPFKYLKIKGFWEGMAPVKTNPYWGYIDLTGKEVIRPGYLIAYYFVNGLASVENYTGDGLGVINKKGETIIPFQYQSIGYFYEGLACAQKNGKWGFINEQNEVIIRFKYEKAGNFYDGCAAVKKKSDNSNTWGCIDENGQALTKFQFSNAKTARQQVK